MILTENQIENMVKTLKCGAEMALGIMEYEGKPILRDAAALHKGFVEKAGASVCKDLKGVETGKVICECDDCVRYAVDFIEERVTK